MATSPQVLVRFETADASRSVQPVKAGQERSKLDSRHQLIGREGCRRRSRCHPVRVGPSHRLGEVPRRFDIVERVRHLRRWLASLPPQERDRLSTSHRFARAEPGQAHARGDAVVVGPCHGVGEVALAIDDGAVGPGSGSPAYRHRKWSVALSSYRHGRSSLRCIGRDARTAHQVTASFCQPVGETSGSCSVVTES